MPDQRPRLTLKNEIMAPRSTAACAIDLNDLVQAFVAATSAARALNLKVPLTINPPIFSNQPTEDVGLFFNEYETVCSAQGRNAAQLLNRLPISLKDNALSWWHRRPCSPGETWSAVKGQMTNTFSPTCTWR